MVTLALGTHDGQVLLFDAGLEPVAQHRMCENAINGVCALQGKLLAVDDDGMSATIQDQHSENAAYVGLVTTTLDGNPVAVAADASGSLVVFSEDAPALDHDFALGNQTPSAITSGFLPDSVLVGTAAGRVFSCDLLGQRAFPPITEEVSALVRHGEALFALDERGGVWHWTTQDDAPVTSDASAVALCAGALGVLLATGDRVWRFGGDTLVVLESPVLALVQGDLAVYAALQNGLLCLLLPSSDGTRLSVARKRKTEPASLLAMVDLQR